MIILSVVWFHLSSAENI